MTIMIEKEMELLANLYGARLGGIPPSRYLKERPDGPYVVFEFAEPTERLYALLAEVNLALAETNPFRNKSTIKARIRKPRNRLDITETRYLQRELSESLTVDRHTFGDDFFARYTASVTALEESIVGKANYIVYGRRGSGKSSLLAYAMHSAIREGNPICWVAMQTYSERNDFAAVASVLAEIVREAGGYAQERSEFDKLGAVLDDLGAHEDTDVIRRIERNVPKLRSLLGSLALPDKPLNIFLDDVHVLGELLQPRLLGLLYSAARGNNIYLKGSGIEQFTRPWDAGNRRGVEPGHDTQILKLDYNLTMPDKSLLHIRGILDAHARYCGLPAISYIAGDDVVERLVLVAAAVPRDALSLFSAAIRKSTARGQQAVSVTAVNSAASETIEEKLRDVRKDTSSDIDELRDVLDRVKEFCLTHHRGNAFLVRINTTSHGYTLIQRLVALRFVHVLHEGITPHEAGKRYIALMLDFGFYIGIRAAKSVQLFPERPRQLAAKELRKLPIFDPDSRGKINVPRSRKSSSPAGTKTSDEEAVGATCTTETVEESERRD